MLTLNKLIKCDGKEPEEMNRAQFIKCTAANHSSLSVAGQLHSYLFYSQVPLPCCRELEMLCEANGTYFSFTLSVQSPPAFILLHWVFGSVIQRFHVVSGDQPEPSPVVSPVQTAGRCAGGGRCLSLCSMLVHIRKDVKCQACFTMKLYNLYGFYIILTWRTGLRCKH